MEFGLKVGDVGNIRTTTFYWRRDCKHHW